jgi:hypothetical protein
MKLVYIAQPYSSPSPEIRKLRYEAAVYALAHFIRIGVPAFSPIAHSYDAACNYNLGQGYEQWRDVSEAILPACNGFVVLMLTGWQDSIGIREEMKFWLDVRKLDASAIDYLEPRAIGLSEDGEPL